MYSPLSLVQQERVVKEGNDPLAFTQSTNSILTIVQEILEIP